MKVALPEARDRFVVVGKSGSGKSTYVKRMIAGWIRQGVRVVALDVCDEYSRKGNDGALVQLGPLRDRVTVEELAAENGAQLLESRLSLSVVCGESPRAAARAFLLLESLLRGSRKQCVLVVDEVGLWTDSSADPLCHRARAQLAGLAVAGRKHGLSLVIVAQRAAQISTTVRSQVTQLVSFAQHEPADLDALAERAGKDFAEKVSRLKPFECIAWSDAVSEKPTNPAPTEEASA